MSDSVIIILVLLFIALAAAGVAYLYGDYRSGQQQARLSRSNRQPSPPAPQLPAAQLPPPPQRVQSPGDKRIVFGATEEMAPLVRAGMEEAPPIQVNAVGERRCPVCRQPISAVDYAQDRAVICPHCRTHSHVECWEYSGRCPSCGR